MKHLLNIPRDIVIGCVLLCIVVAASWALFISSELFRVHDYIHAARTVEMLRGLQDGQFPVRWSQHFGYGYGMPLFLFYAPLPYYFSAVLYWFGLSIEWSVKSLFLVAHIGSIVGAYLLAKRMFGRIGGMLSAAAFGLAPYRALNLYVRGAVAESWGMMVMPWVMLGIVDVVEGRRHGWKILLVSSIVLILSHNLTSLLFFPLAAVFGLLYLIWWASRRRHVGVTRESLQVTALRRICIAFTTMMAAAATTAWYTVPALLEKGQTQIDSILGGYFSYHQHFLYIRQFWDATWGYGGSVWGLEDDISFFLGWGQWIGLILLVILGIWQARRGLKRLWLRFGPLFAAGVLSVTALFMSILKSKSLWDVLPLIDFIQFPWRFLSVAVLGIALLVAGITTLVPKIPRILLAWMLLPVLLVNAIYFQPERFLDDSDSLYYTDSERIAREMSGILPDYLPQQIDPEIEPNLEAITSSHSEVAVLEDSSTQVLATISTEEQDMVVFGTADFPGWKAYIDGELVEHGVTENGLIQIEVPSGVHQVGLRFERTQVRLIADLISITSIAAVAVVWSVGLWKQRRAHD